MREEIEERVKQIIVEKLGVKEEEVRPEAELVANLGADSLDTVELVMEFEKTFNVCISDDVAAEIQTVGDMVDAIVQLKNRTDYGLG